MAGINWTALMRHALNSLVTAAAFARRVLIQVPTGVVRDRVARFSWSRLKQRVRNLLLRVIAPVPRFLFLLVVILGLVFAFYTMLAPIELVCSYKTGSFCQIVSFASLPWLNPIAQSFRNSVLCEMSTVTCSEGMSLGEVQSTFQVLLGYTLTLNFVSSFWDRCRDSLQGIGAQLKKLTSAAPESKPVEEPDYLLTLERRENIWRPWYYWSFAAVVAFVRAGYILTAFVSGTVLVLTLIEKDQPLPFKEASAIFFVFAPLFAAGLLRIFGGFIDQFLLVCIAPGFHWRRYKNRRTDIRALKKLGITSNSELSFLGDQI